MSDHEVFLIYIQVVVFSSVSGSFEQPHNRVFLHVPNHLIIILIVHFLKKKFNQLYIVRDFGWVSVAVDGVQNLASKSVENIL